MHVLALYLCLSVRRTAYSNGAEYLHSRKKSTVNAVYCEEQKYLEVFEKKGRTIEQAAYSSDTSRSAAPKLLLRILGFNSLFSNISESISLPLSAQ